MPAGAGFSPAGLSPAGYGSVDTAVVSPNSPLPAAATGVSQTGRYIDSKTNDYVFLPDGRLQGMTTVQQLVTLAIKGIDTSTLTEKGPNFKSVLMQIVSNALAPLVAQKLVRIRQIVAFSVYDAGLAQVDWEDLTTGTYGQTTVGDTGTQ